jgi:bifunctional DNA-binding transcriptional regulator/antitoxin component of YhaV-PrlF toxin-antitoxin module
MAHLTVIPSGIRWVISIKQGDTIESIREIMICVMMMIYLKNAKSRYTS